MTPTQAVNHAIRTLGRDAPMVDLSDAVLDCCPYLDWDTRDAMAWLEAAEAILAKVTAR